MSRLARAAALAGTGCVAVGMAACAGLAWVVGAAMDAAMLEDEARAIGRHPFEQAETFVPGMCRCGKGPDHPVHQEAPTDDR